MWSYSRISCFHNCKYEYYLNYVLCNSDLYFPENNFYAEVGSYVHEILAMIFKGHLKVEDSLQYYIDNYDNFVYYKVRKNIMERSFEIIADYFAALDLDWLKDYEILGVELESNFKIGNYNFVGFMDLLLRDKRDGEIVIVDHKSAPYPLKLNGEVKKSAQANFETHKKQLYIYAHAVKQLYGKFPKQLWWNHFKNAGKFVHVPFSESEYNGVIEWCRATIKDIERENAYESAPDFFYCSELCNFRHSCEYCK